MITIFDMFLFTAWGTMVSIALPSSSSIEFQGGERNRINLRIDSSIGMKVFNIIKSSALRSGVKKTNVSKLFNAMNIQVAVDRVKP